MHQTINSGWHWRNEVGVFSFNFIIESFYCKRVVFVLKILSYVTGIRESWKSVMKFRFLLRKMGPLSYYKS